MFVCASRRGSRVAPAPLDSAQKVQAALQARQHRETQMALERRALTGATASTSGHIQPYLSSFTSSFSHHLSILTIFHIQLSSLALPPPLQVTILHIKRTHHLSHIIFFTIFHIQAYLPSSHPAELSSPFFTSSCPHDLSPPNFLTIFTSKFLHHLSVASFVILPPFRISSQLGARHHLSHPKLLIALHRNGCQLAARMSLCPICAILQRH